MPKATVSALKPRAAKAPDSSSKRKVSFSVETITPDQARIYLEKILPGRGNDTRASAAYAEAMRNGAWVVNGMPIVFDGEGVVLDGVVRLNACIQAGVPFTTVVARNVRRDTLHTIDQHRRRNYQGVLESRGIRNAGALIRLMGKLIRIQNGLLGLDNMQISWNRYDRVLDANPQLAEAVNLSLDTKSAKLHSTARHVLVYMAMSAGQTSQLRQFLSSISEPEAYPLDHPGRMLSMQLDMYKTATGDSMDVDQALAIGIQAYEAMKAGEKVTRAFQWKPDYGKNTKLNEFGQPVSRKEARENAPDNMGLPVVTGYPGIKDAVFDPRRADEFTGPLAESLRAGGVEVDGITIEAMTVTPEIARDWLAKHNRSNRKVLQNHVRNIKRDIVNGRWMFNAQPICFGVDGRLLNGQHRLFAAIEAETPIDVVVVHGITDAAFTTYDIHAKKTTSVAVGNDNADPRVIAAAGKIQWRVDSGLAPGATAIKPTAAELQETLLAHPGLSEGFSQARRLMKIGSAAVMTFLIYHTRYERPDIAEDFLKQLETGEGLTRDNPLLRVRNALLAARGEDKRRDRLLTLLEAWNSYKNFRDEESSILV